ncbi:glycosyl transferase [Siminovitchia terrae]|uniref:Glycosyl transferase n=1 Tax=Siminovitchia terrae TaxID=1914933 RepID=A0ABQ4KXV2_SIMTE|nr:glycosyltransferase family 2 protein [Siminovitchia terrae]GIN96857.1 glycosyl transferase [Siminovitchia terrae]
MTNLVSIIMPAYNAEKYIAYSIESIIAQDYPNWELLVVDDCSNDGTRKILEKYSNLDNRIKLISLDNNCGVAKARNIAINNSNGKYIAFLDSDDIWHPDKLTEQISFMSKNNYPFSFTSYELIDAEGQETKKIINAPPKVDYQGLLKGNIIGCLTVVIDKGHYQNISMPVIKHEDYATWLQLLKGGSTAYGMSKVLAQYRKTNTSVSSNKVKSVLWTWNIYRSYLQLGLFKSVFCITSYAVNAFKKHYF